MNERKQITLPREKFEKKKTLEIEATTKQKRCFSCRYSMKAEIQKVANNERTMSIEEKKQTKKRGVTGHWRR